MLLANLVACRTQPASQGEIIPFTPTYQLHAGFGGLSASTGTYYLELGQPLEYTISWRSTGPSLQPMNEVRVFVHFINDRGALVGADDHDLPTAQPDLSYSRIFSLPETTLGRRLTVRIGLYQTATGDRLRLRDAHGEIIPYQEFGPVYLISERRTNFFSGWYEADVLANGTRIRWMSDHSQFVFKHDPTAPFLAISGGYETACLDGLQSLNATIDGLNLGSFELAPDSFELTLPLPAREPTDSQPWRILDLTAERSFVPVNCVAGSIDNRKLSVFIRRLEPTSFHYLQGWYPEEFDASGSWRWCEQQAALTMAKPECDSLLIVSIGVPLACYSSPPTLTLLLNNEKLTDLHLTQSDMIATTPISPEKFGAESTGRLVLVLDRAFTPHECSGSADTRRLGVMIRSIRLIPAP